MNTSIVALEKGVAVARPDQAWGIGRGFFPQKAIGLYIILWNNGGFKGRRRVNVALLEKSRGENIVYQYRTGPRMGRRFSAPYKVGDQVAVFKPEDLVELYAYVKDLNKRKGFE
jgi:hypothetical protein